MRRFIAALAVAVGLVAPVAAARPAGAAPYQGHVMILAQGDVTLWVPVRYGACAATREGFCRVYFTYPSFGVVEASTEATYYCLGTSIGRQEIGVYNDLPYVKAGEIVAAEPSGRAC